jgi:hypothetical protein
MAYCLDADTKKLLEEMQSKLSDLQTRVTGDLPILFTRALSSTRGLA